jgi:para-aminobenzoate synthetase/4-amino-4-deoxychorismate lyase
LPEYARNIQRIKEYIAQGLTYQVNYTIKCRFKFQGSSFSLYKNLRNAQPVAYSSFIRDRQFSLLSFSPELFFRKKGELIKVTPMKGTISRGKTEKEDRFKMWALKASQKDRSENVMIVDLLRNDLGRISEVGSVRTVRLYKVEKYKTLFQLTSTIQARLEGNPSVYEIFKSIFPSGSVTGAPKIKTMEIIRELERKERRVYTGAIGFFKPNRDAVFNVAIRTLLLRGGSGEMGIGSGIVYDSDPEKEYRECQLKALFFTQRQKEFQLIETMRWSKRSGFFLLPYHLTRLKSSAGYFNFSFNAKRIKQRLSRISRDFNPAFTYRVRLLLFSSGDVSINYQRIKRLPKKEIPRVTFTRKKTNSQDIAFYHKTTDRRIYDQEYQRAKSKGFYEVIFENERNEITEGTISNIFIRQGKIYYTPPTSCGLLNGVYRQYLMQKKTPPVKERVLRRSDLCQADAIYLTNAVRGMTRVRLF